MFSNFQPPKAPDGQLNPPTLHHQVLVIDRDFVNFPHELHLLTKSIRSILLLVFTISRSQMTKLPAIAIFVYNGETDMEIAALQPTIVSQPTISDILAVLGNLETSCTASKHRMVNPVVDWHRFFDNLKLSTNFLLSEKYQLTFFNRNPEANYSGLTVKIPKISKFVVATFNKGTLLMKLADIFAYTSVKKQEVPGFGKVTEYCLAPIQTEIEMFLKQEVFFNWISKPFQLEIVLPSTSFTRSPVIVICEAYPTTVSSELCPGLDFGETQSNTFLLSTSSDSTSENDSIRLETVARVETTKVCPSLIFGCQNFLLALPSTDDENQKLYHSFCHEMSINSQSVIVRLINSENESSFEPHYLITPTTNQQMILQCLATSEILLPVDPESIPVPETDSEGDDVTNIEVKASLAKLKFEESYNPFEFNCGFYNSVQTQVKKQKGQRQDQGARSTAPTSSRGRGRGKNRDFWDLFESE